MSIIMNEIDKLKAEHARYKKALAKIQDQYLPSADAYRYADVALNPPPPTPVTLESLQAALRKINTDDDSFHSIAFYQDGSGDINNSDDVRVFSFNNLQEAQDYLEAQ